jgi:hypothetical protein
MKTCLGLCLVVLAVLPAASTALAEKNQSPGGPPKAPPAAGKASAPVLQNKHQDWEVLTNVVDGKTWCWARTFATGISPTNWRTDRPSMLFRVSEGVTNVTYRFDAARHWQAGVRFTGNVTGGNDLYVPITRSDNYLLSQVPCGPDGKMCVSTPGLQGLTKGSRLDIAGRTFDGRPAKITYSLLGYTAAITEINSMCNNATNTGWLIK